MEECIRNKKLIETFIFVHDQNIILDFIQQNRFSEFNNLNYVFVGNRPVDKIIKLSNVIICKNLKDNIEQYPSLTSYTGWYALVKNNLIAAEYVNLFEYDINYVEDFTNINLKTVQETPDIIGYLPMQLTDPVYIQWENLVKELIDSISIKTKVNVRETINDIIKKYPHAVWSSSSNSTWKTSALLSYIEWFHQFVEDIIKSKYCGHMHERSISFYYFIHKLKTYVVKNVISHLQLNSHQTSDNLSQDRFSSNYCNLK